MLLNSGLKCRGSINTMISTDMETWIAFKGFWRTSIYILKEILGKKNWGFTVTKCTLTVAAVFAANDGNCEINLKDSISPVWIKAALSLSTSLNSFLRSKDLLVNQTLEERVSKNHIRNYLKPATLHILAPSQLICVSKCHLLSLLYKTKPGQAEAGEEGCC